MEETSRLSVGIGLAYVCFSGWGDHYKRFADRGRKIIGLQLRDIYDAPTRDERVNGTCFVGDRVPPPLTVDSETRQSPKPVGVWSLANDKVNDAFVG